MKVKENKTFLDLFEKSKDVFIKNFFIILKFAMIFALIGTFSQWLIIVDLENQGFNYINDFVSKDWEVQAPNNTWPIILVNIILDILTMILAAVLIIYLYFDFIGKNKLINECFGFLKTRLLDVVFTAILQTILLIFLFILLIVPGIIFSIYWIFVYLVVLFRKKSFFNALTYSFNLVRYNWWRTLGYLVILVIILIAIYVVFVLIYALIMFFGNLNNILFLILNFIQLLIVLPLNYFLLIFLINYFLVLEDEKKEEFEMMEKLDESGDNLHENKKLSKSKSKVEKKTKTKISIKNKK
ncbi:MAG: glycerophosphoryl diester phosphodiesterase membrane domain-containing protein [Nanoarchaeota archaeon]|nr:glycerophosphoryl diester phosphodiesterase membrane domain-containing protein [Nanoarchaeota archaeon]